MKNFTLTILIVMYSNFLFSQSQDKKLNLTKDSDTLYWNKYKNDLIKKHNLEDITNKSDEINFKFWSFGKCIEVIKNDSLSIGNITYFVDEVDDFSKKHFKKTFNLTNETAKEITNLIEKTKINTIPSDKFIEGWQQGFDGIEYIFEYKTKTEYSFKNYWTPTAQENIEEAKRIQKFVDELYQICDSENLSKQFSNEIPFRSYSYNGGSIVVSRIMIKEEYRKFKKEKRKRRRQN
ncbi:hypothetical protein L1S34_07195 [Flavobacterium sp. K77]|uniref:hypothetical protein n=1 Tax=Flavobacterium sp. K77 TaxID=2910676 RepID=UPI001F1DD978|nr:hypothetical protein [Flavobacterium sp. K77]MCF6141066.1 hypothetical protein [Flavobacterium sp. K77]